MRRERFDPGRAGYIRQRRASGGSASASNEQYVVAARLRGSLLPALTTERSVIPAKDLLAPAYAETIVTRMGEDA